jgi:SAM-dependent methyltransferase
MNAIQYFESIPYETTFYPDTDSGCYKIADKALNVIVSAGMQPGAKVLELGCGTGVYTELFACSGADITAVDGSPKMIRAAADRCGPKIKYVVSDVHNLPLEDKLFDAVVGVWILQYTDIYKVIREVNRVLHPGGRAVFIESNPLNPVTLWRAFNNKVAHPPLRWHLDKYLSDGGFSEVVAQPFEFMPSSLDGKVFKVLKPLFHALDGIPVIREFAGSIIVSATKTQDVVTL